MSLLYVTLLERDFVASMARPGVRLEVESFETRDIGGAYTATLRATGDPQALDQLVTRLRCPVEILDARERLAWHGYVHEVKVSRGNAEYGVTLDGLANRVSISYSRTDAGGETPVQHTLTSWAEDSGSIALYGYREAIESMSQATQTAAETRRDELLAERRYPRQLLAPLARPGQASARIICRGWWSSADWRYYSSTNYGVMYSPAGGETHDLARSADNQAIAQSFLTPATVPWTVISVRANIARDDTMPHDGLTCDLCADAAGAPGAVLTTGHLANHDFDTTLSKRYFSMTRYQLAAATTYWLKFRRDDNGYADPGFYIIRNIRGASGYADGIMRRYGPAAWHTIDGDVKFEVVGDRQTSQMIGDIVTDKCQFLTGWAVDTASGIYDLPSRGGEKTAKAEIEALLARGVASSRRYIAHVERARQLHVQQEPVAGSADYILLANGTLLDPLKNVVPPYLAPAGTWVWIDAVPDAANLAVIAQAKRIYAEGWRYTARDNRAVPIARNERRAPDIVAFGARR